LGNRQIGFYARNPRKKDTAIDRMCASIREFGFKIPVLARSDGTVVCGQLITVNYASGRRSITERNQDRRLVRGARRLWRDRVGESAGMVRDGSAPERRAAILIERLDRLARELFIQEYILRDLKQRGVPLISAAEPDLDSDPGRVLFRQMMGAIAATLNVERLPTRTASARWFGSTVAKILRRETEERQ
jgi:hypothetical protein